MDIELNDTITAADISTMDEAAALILEDQMNEALDTCVSMLEEDPAQVEESLQVLDPVKGETKEDNTPDDGEQKRKRDANDDDVENEDISPSKMSRPALAEEEKLEEPKE